MDWKALGAVLLLTLLAHAGPVGAAEPQKPATTASANKATSKPTEKAHANETTESRKAAPSEPKPTNTDKSSSVKTSTKGAKPSGKVGSASPSPGSLPAVDDKNVALPAPGIDPKRGRGARNVGSEAASAVEEAPEPSVGSGVPEPRSGKTQAKPAKRSVLPKGTPRPTPDAAQRRQIAGGVTADEVAAGKDDTELRSLRDAELVLFPRPLPGFVPGWSWDLPKPTEPSPEIIAGAPASSRLVTPKSEPPRDAAWLRGLTLPNIPVRFEERVIRYLAFYRDAGSGRSIARVWARKSGRYAPVLKAELAKAGLPSDLVWLSLVESAHNPLIVSPLGAAGLWQFMPDAGRAYGLAIDRWVDERFDPQRSTEAACRYLSDLYRRFGTWDLAMAAYNMGHGGLSRAIRKYNTNDFWELSRYEAGVPWETALYVPKILATAVLMTNKRVFGVDDIEPEPPERFDTVQVSAGVLLEDISRLVRVPLTTLEALNPQYLAGRTPPAAPGDSSHSWPLRVPEGTGAAVRGVLSHEPLTDESLAAYVVRTGDTVESIAQVRGTTEAQIRALNRVDPKEVLAPGTVLLVPNTQKSRVDEVADNVAVVPGKSFEYPDRRRLFYRVLSGDSLSRIAEVFAVGRSEIADWNALDESARLHAGMMLQLFVPPGRDLSRVRYLSESKAKILVAGSPEFFDYFEAQNGRRRFVVRAKTGDTLSSIGKRYGSTVGSMERINRRSRTDPISASEPIVVYTERTRPVPGDELYVNAGARTTESQPLGLGSSSGPAAAVDVSSPD